MAKKKRKTKIKKQERKRQSKRPKKVVSSFEESTVKKIKIRVIGIGGGAGSIISEIAPKIKKADFMAVNTDASALREIGRKVKKFQFGQKLTQGLGTGMNVALAELAVQEEKDKIKKLFEGRDLCIIISCLGGGAGSGATPVFAKILKSLGCLTYGIFTMPFNFEGEKKIGLAKESLEKIKPYLNAFSIIPNERIFRIIDKNTPLKEALSAINQRLVQNLEGLIEMIYSPGLINIDFADLKTILAGQGRLACLNTIEIEESNQEEGVKKLILSPLYPYTLKGSKGVLYNIIGSKGLQLIEVSRISETISGSINKNAKIIFGIGQDNKYKEKLKITLLAIGCLMKNEAVKPQLKFQPKPQPRPRPEPKPKPKPKSKPKPRPRFRPKPKKKEPPLSKPQEVQKEDKNEAQGEKVRRNAIQLKKVIEEEEKEILEKEKIWETPAILRRKNE